MTPKEILEAQFGECYKPEHDGKGTVTVCYSCMLDAVNFIHRKAQERALSDQKMILKCLWKYHKDSVEYPCPGGDNCEANLLLNTFLTKKEREELEKENE